MTIYYEKPQNIDLFSLPPSSIDLSEEDNSPKDFFFLFTIARCLYRKESNDSDLSEALRVFQDRIEKETLVMGKKMVSKAISDDTKARLYGERVLADRSYWLGVMSEIEDAISSKI